MDFARMIGMYKNRGTIPDYARLLIAGGLN
jgi:hypothetical protein